MSGLDRAAHCWSRLAPDASGARGRAALFLDRDGVVVRDIGYLCDPAKVELTPGAGEAVARARAAGLAVVLVTNQSGVGRGYYDWAAFEAVQAEIARQLLAAAPGARLDAAFACGFDPSGPAGGEHPWRKPSPGMLLAARDGLGVELSASWIVGDRAADLVAGRAAGLAGGVLVATCQGDRAERTAAEALRSGDFAVMLADDLRAAVTDLEARGWTVQGGEAPTPC